MNNEPVAWMIKTLDGKRLMLYGDEQPPKFEDEVQSIPLYTHPADLTDEEIAVIWANHSVPMTGMEFKKVVEAILKKANNG